MFLGRFKDVGVSLFIVFSIRFVVYLRVGYLGRIVGGCRVVGFVFVVFFFRLFFVRFFGVRRVS